MKAARSRWIASLAVLALTLACAISGGSEPEGSSTPAALRGSCDMIASQGTCQELDADHPDEPDCYGTWRDTGCPTEGRFAVCRSRGALIGGVRTYYYEAPPTQFAAEHQQRSCLGLNIGGQTAEYEVLAAPPPGLSRPARHRRSGSGRRR